MDAFEEASVRILAEWALVSTHVPADAAALVFPLRAISLLSEGRPTFDGEQGSISVARDYLGDVNDPASTAVIVAVHVGDSLAVAAFAEGRLIAESGVFPSATLPIKAGEDVPELLDLCAQDWVDARRHVPDEILDSLGSVQNLLVAGKSSSSFQILCTHGFIAVEHNYLEEQNAMGSTTAVRVLSYLREAIEMGVRYQALYSDRELVE